MSPRRDEPHGTTRTALARPGQAGPMAPWSVHCRRGPGLGEVSVKPGRGSRVLAPTALALPCTATLAGRDVTSGTPGTQEALGKYSCVEVSYGCCYK